jgi:DinB superfamily
MTTSTQLMRRRNAKHGDVIFGKFGPRALTSYETAAGFFCEEIGMKTIEFIRMSLDMSAGMALELIDDMKDQPLTFPTPKGGNHPLWVMGHLAWTEGGILHIMIGRPNPLENWKPLFGFGSEPSADASKYPSLDELKKAFQEQRAQTLEVLGTLTDADLDQPSKGCPTEAKSFVGTYAQCFLVLIANTTSHNGQLTDARRAAGRKPLHM